MTINEAVYRIRMPRPHRPGASALRLGLAVAVAGLAVEIGRLVAEGNVRMLSVAIMVVAAPIVVTLQPVTALAVVLAITPLPLYMQGVEASLLVPAVAGVWLVFLIANRNTVRVQADRPYLLALGLVLVTSLVTLTTGDSFRTGADIAAFGNLLVGIALFKACIVILKTPAQVHRAFYAFVVGGYIVIFVTLCQYFEVGLPGLISGSGAQQIGESGLASNLRIGGPFGDFELLSEFFGLVGTVAIQLTLTTRGRQRLVCGLFVPLAVLGIAATSTRSGLVILVLGAAAVALSRHPLRRTVLIVVAAGAVMLALLPVIDVLQTRANTGFLFQRLDATSYSSEGLLGFIDRGRVWEHFLIQLPSGFDLIFGQGLAFDYPRYGLYPHGLPLTLLFTVGLVGLVAFFFLVGSIAWRCLQRWRRDNFDLAFLGMVIVALFAVDELKIEYVRIFNYQWFIWGLLGVAAAAALARQETTR